MWTSRIQEEKGRQGGGEIHASCKYFISPRRRTKLFWSTRETVVIITVRQLGVTKWGKGEGCLRSLMD